MGLTIKASEPQYECATPGTHVAICIGVAEIGHQTLEYDGERTVKPQVVITWELAGEPRADGWPFKVSKFYNLTLHERSSLYKDLVAWRGREFTFEELQGFDLKVLVGKPCMISVKDNKGRSMVDGVMSLLKGAEVPPQVNEGVVFEIVDYLNGNHETYDKLPEWIKRQVQASKEVSESRHPPNDPTHVAVSHDEDEPPF